MCMIDGADCCYDRVSTSKDRVARKKHKCHECGRLIVPGERYKHSHGIDSEGSAYVYKVCSHCMVGASWLSENCGGWLRYGIREDLHEHVAEYGYTRAKAIIGVARIVIGMRRKWSIKRGPKAGQMMKIPQLPAQLEPLAH